MNTKKHILIAPLNWGLGHAARCIPIIHTLLSENYKVTIASDGDALGLLKKEFPALSNVLLPSYNIVYSKEGRDLKRKLITSLPAIGKTIRAEHKTLEKLIPELGIDGVISDNRIGLYTNKVPCIIISHQLQVLSGTTTWLSTAMHRMYLKRFNVCWVPDIEGDLNLSGILGHPQKKLAIPTKYIGLLSRMVAREETIKYDYIAILSGPEPQRSMLEYIILQGFKKTDKRVLLVQGIIEEEQQIQKIGNHIEVVNFLTTNGLERAINQSDVVIARSGYTTIMDLAVMKKKVFFIPTPGQREQEYLAERLEKQKVAPYTTQNEFNVSDLSKILRYQGFKRSNDVPDLTRFFDLFKSK